MAAPNSNRGDPAIVARDLTKTYGKDVRALQGLSLTVERGTIFGMLGPNGAGKSTTVKILTTLSRPDSGAATVEGIDVLARPQDVRHVTGTVGQKSAVDPAATGRENLQLQGRFYGLAGSELRRRIDEQLKRFGLREAGSRLVGTYSGGMQRKLDVAMGLIHSPRVLFLDEPTTGLDPEARTELWAEIRRLADEEGLTILLTTHYLEEADQLCARIAIVDGGRVVAEGSPDELKAELRGDAIVAELRDPEQAQRALTAVDNVDGLRDATIDGRSLRARADRGPAAVPSLIAALDAADIAIAAVTVARPSLDDVYLRHTGRSYAANQESYPMTASAVSVPAARTGGPSLAASTVQTLAVMQRHVRMLLRQPAFVMITIVQPAIWLVLFGALFSNVVQIPRFAASGSTTSYIDYLAPAVLVMTALFSSGWVGMGIIEDIDRGIMDRFLTAPVRRGALIAGHQAYAAVNLLIQSLIIGVMAFLLGATFEGGIGGFAILVVAALLLGAAFGALSDATALVLRQRESVIGVNTMLTLPLTFLSTAFMPLALVPDWIAKVAAVNPVNWAVEAGRAGFSGTGDAGYIFVRLGMLALLAVACMLLATRAFRSYQRSV